SIRVNPDLRDKRIMTPSPKTGCEKNRTTSQWERVAPSDLIHAFIWVCFPMESGRSLAKGFLARKKGFLPRGSGPSQHSSARPRSSTSGRSTPSGKSCKNHGDDEPLILISC